MPVSRPWTRRSTPQRRAWGKQPAAEGRRRTTSEVVVGAGLFGSGGRRPDGADLPRRAKAGGGGGGGGKNSSRPRFWLVGRRRDTFNQRSWGKTKRNEQVRP